MNRSKRITYSPSEDGLSVDRFFFFRKQFDLVQVMVPFFLILNIISGSYFILAHG